MLFTEERNYYLSNAFSLSMLGNTPDATLHIQKVAPEFVASILKRNRFISAVGHEATAGVLSQILGVQVPYNRIAITLTHGDMLFVAQIQVRLEEGRILTTEEILKLLEEGKIVFYLVYIE